MSSTSCIQDTFRSDKWFYGFLILHVFFWTLAPTLVRMALPLDAMEGTTWGHQLEWGYDKNPYLNAWLTQTAVFLGGKSGWMIYLFSQLCVAACFWVVWEFGKKFLNPLYALVAVILLAGAQYYNLHAIDFNDNTLETGLWPLTVWFFYLALSKQQTRDWLLTGFFAGLAIMTKYYSALLLIPMFFFLCYRAENRQSFRQPGIYLAALLFTLIVIPHFIWLFQHDFITVTYAVDRVSEAPSLSRHFVNPTVFAWEQIEVFLIPLALSILLILGKKPIFEQKRILLTPYDREFLLVIGLGPFLLTLLIGAVAGMHLRAGWGAPLLTFWTLILLVILQPQLTIARLQRFLLCGALLLITIVLAYCYSLTKAGNQSSANYPGVMMAHNLTHQWHNTYHTRLEYVAGERWLAGNIAFYSTDDPSVYIDWNPKVSPWIKEEQLKQQGALFVWEITDNNFQIPSAIKQRFPNLENLQIQHYPWFRDKNGKPVILGVAMLPPA